MYSKGVLLGGGGVCSCSPLETKITYGVSPRSFGSIKVKLTSQGREISFP
jgi:hypothetical protein